jgi:hypothetical protein
MDNAADGSGHLTFNLNAPRFFEAREHLGPIGFLHMPDVRRFADQVRRALSVTDTGPGYGHQA